MEPSLQGNLIWPCRKGFHHKEAGEDVLGGVLVGVNRDVVLGALLGGVPEKYTIIWVGATNDAFTVDPMRPCHAAPGVAVTAE